MVGSSTSSSASSCIVVEFCTYESFVSEVGDEMWVVGTYRHVMITGRNCILELGRVNAQVEQDGPQPLLITSMLP